MSYEKRDSLFLYHAYALGLGGWVERDGRKYPIDSLAPGVLSVVGGETKTTSPAWRFKQDDFYVSVDSAVARLWTEETDDAWISNVETTLSGFDLSGRVQARTIVARLTSTHKKQVDPRRPRKERAKISFKGSRIEGLSIERKEVPFGADDVLDEFATHGELTSVLAGKNQPKPRPGLDARACAAWGGNYKRRSLLTSVRGDAPYVTDLVKKFVSPGVTRCTIAAQEIPDLGLKHVRPRGYSVEIEDFGRVFFGEMIVSNGMKRLNMVRWDLGCTNCGGGTGGAADVNGESMP